MASKRTSFSLHSGRRKNRASLAFETLESRAMLASDLYITEFSASNESILDDGDGNASDWIEVFNAGSAAINLEDYYLTDDATSLTKWNLPATTLGAGQFLVIFATGQATDNYVDAGGNYHTNFKIDKDGEYLASVYEHPTTHVLSVVNDFAPVFPEQFSDVTYGLAMTGGGLEVDAVVQTETDIAPAGPANGTPYNPTFAAGGPSSTDLLQGLTPSSSSGNFELEASTGVSALTDGSVSTSYGSSHSAYATAGDGHSLTYTLPVAADIGEIVIYGGWVDGGRDAQHYEIEVSSNSGNSFVALGSVNINPGIQGVHERPISSRVSFSAENAGTLAAGVTDIRINFLNVENGYTGYTEIDVFESANASNTILVDDDTLMSYLLPTSGALGTAWTQAGFDDSAWQTQSMTATAGIGYEDSPQSETSYASLLDVEVPSQTTSVYTRFEFELDDPAEIASLSLGMLYDDGFVAYLNGVKLVDANAPANPAWNSTAADQQQQRPDESVLDSYVNFDVNAHLDELVTGTNVLAIHALNLPSSSDMLMVPRLTAVANPSIVGLDAVGYFETATPGSLNGSEVYEGFVEDTKFSVDRGFYTEAIEVAITSQTAGATIVYTTDGSIPTVDANLNVTNGTLYSAALPIASTTNLRARAFKANHIPTDVDTHTYVFLDDVIQQTAASQEAALEQGLPSSAGNGVDFGLDPDILNSVTTQQVKESLSSLPTISLTLENGDFLGTNGIYTNSTATGPSSERPVSAELIYPDGTEGFQVDAGIRIQGAASRSLAEKYSFRLAFRGKYGPTDLIYPLFGSGVDKFDTIVLRSVFNDGYGWRGDDNNLREQLYIRDLWFRETQLAMGQPAARGNWAHLYVNGQYWGLYHPSERPDADFAQETIGGDNDLYDTINHGGVIDDASEHDPSNNVSATTVYNTAISLAHAVNNAVGQSAKNAAYQALQGNFPDGTDNPNQEAYLDVENYIDYMILNMFGGNDDWPVNNWFTNRLRGPDSDGFRFYAWDSEISLSLSTRTNVFKNYTVVSGGAAEFYGILRNYEEFRVQFGDRIHQHLFNDGALAGDQPADRFASLADDVRDAILGESARWGDQHFSNNPITVAEWEAELNRMLADYFVDRPPIAMAQFRGANLYPHTDAPEFLVDSVAQHGGAIASGALLEFVNPSLQGTIYYTTDGTDPRLLGGAINVASANVASGNLPLTGTVQIKARVLSGGEWSALSDATFVINPAAAGNLAITELNYNPYDALPQYGDLNVDNDEFEFIELRNVGSEAIDLAGVEFDDSSGEGVSFTFGPQVLSPNEYVLVVRNQSAFESRYGFGLNIVGEFEGALSNGGEQLTLRDASGGEIQVFTYDDSGSWPGRADGTGSSLEIVDTAGDYNDDQSWRSSSEFGGSLGAAGAGPVRDVIVNEVLSRSDGGGLDLIELYNTTDSSIDLQQWYLSDSNDNLFKFQIASSTLLGPQEYMVLNQTTLGFALDGEFGEDVWLLESDPISGKPTRFADHVEFDASETNVSLGRWPSDDPDADLFPMVSQSFGSANSGPIASDVLISEVHYHPAAVPPAQAVSISQDELEFIEIANVDNSPVDISHWKTDAIEFTFPAGTILAAGEAIVVVTFDPSIETSKASAFRNVFGIGGGPRLFGAADGQLRNSGERVELLRPLDPLTLLLGNVLVDAVRYENLAPWPLSADGTGDSLHRTGASSFGGFATSWLASSATPGTANLFTISADFDIDGDVDGSDFLAWQRGFGTTGVATPQHGDANRDSNVDGADLIIWQTQYALPPASQELQVEALLASSEVDSTELDSLASVAGLRWAPTKRIRNQDLDLAVEGMSLQSEVGSEAIEFLGDGRRPVASATDEAFERMMDFAAQAAQHEAIDPTLSDEPETLGR